jgi:hypothetical protein
LINRLKILYELQLIDDQLDELEELRGDLPHAVESLESKMISKKVLPTRRKRKKILLKKEKRMKGRLKNIRRTRKSLKRSCTRLEITKSMML